MNQQQFDITNNVATRKTPDADYEITQIFGFGLLHALRIEIEATAPRFNDNLISINAKPFPRYQITTYKQNEKTEAKMVAYGQGDTVFEAYMMMRGEYDKQFLTPIKPKEKTLLPKAPPADTLRSIEDLF